MSLSPAYFNPFNPGVNWQQLAAMAQFNPFFIGTTWSPSNTITSYPLLDVPPLVMEQIFTKCKFQSYQRLQQTCRYIQEFIKSSKTIRIHLERDERISCSQKDLIFTLYEFHRPIDYYNAWSLTAFTAVDQSPFWNGPSLQDINGIRFRHLNLAQKFYETENGLDEFLEILEKNRIRCDQVSVSTFGWTIEQFETLLKIVKPSTVEINGSGCSSHYETLLKEKDVKEVSLHLGSDDFFLFAGRFMTTFPAVKISLVGPWDADIDDTFEYCDKILEILHTERPQNLQDFYFYNHSEPQYPTVNEMEEKFRNYNPRVQEKIVPHYSISAWVDLPESLPSNAFCKIRFGNGGISTSGTINYGMLGQNGQPLTKFPYNRD